MFYFDTAINRSESFLFKSITNLFEILIKNSLTVATWTFKENMSRSSRISYLSYSKLNTAIATWKLHWILDKSFGTRWYFSWNLLECFPHCWFLNIWFIFLSSLFWSVRLSKFCLYRISCLEVCFSENDLQFHFGIT